MNDFTSRRISSSQLLCVTPNFTDIFSGSRLYSVTLSFVSDLTVTHSVFSPLLSSWSNIRTTSDSFIRVYDRRSLPSIRMLVKRMVLVICVEYVSITVLKKSQISVLELMGLFMVNLRMSVPLMRYSYRLLLNSDS